MENNNNHDFNDIFPDEFYCTMKESSYDDQNKVYMTTNEREVLKIDDFNKDYFQQEKGCSQPLKGADAVLKSNDKLYIIEFKNCFISKKIKFNILTKMYDSAIVLFDKLNKDIKYFQENAIFVTVYSNEKNLELSDNAIDSYQNQGMNNLKHSIFKRGTQPVKEYDKGAFGLDKLEKYLYKEVVAIRSDCFQSYLEQEEISTNDYIKS